MASHYRKKVRWRQRGEAVGQLKNSLVHSGSGECGREEQERKTKGERERNMERKVLGGKHVFTLRLRLFLRTTLLLPRSECGRRWSCSTGGSAAKKPHPTPAKKPLSPPADGHAFIIHCAA